MCFAVFYLKNILMIFDTPIISTSSAPILTTIAGLVEL